MHSEQHSVSDWGMSHEIIRKNLFEFAANEVQKTADLEGAKSRRCALALPLMVTAKRQSRALQKKRYINITFSCGETFPGSRTFCETQGNSGDLSATMVFSVFVFFSLPTGWLQVSTYAQFVCNVCCVQVGQTEFGVASISWM